MSIRVRKCGEEKPAQPGEVRMMYTGEEIMHTAPEGVYTRLTREHERAGHYVVLTQHVLLTQPRPYPTPRGQRAVVYVAPDGSYIEAGDSCSLTPSYYKVDVDIVFELRPHV